ncbi:hypothetical protein BJ684DRAFT_20284 [Piptocephalis cylindrospora]|uniref:Uncharacterized protein n=1 Tax=Piptocephalis cylindrospora TaxID=1907219 RepID=A0A4P9Y4W5_9FUNG|nr:hypothetical protein BJ684DRAFT_20284 [Piptocephalis cylindrospora]|eukprot:RKP13211.1 hypothetical protein BJ684DRAFT_20284 [Piptocephalis cylindrospora]
MSAWTDVIAISVFGGAIVTLMTVRIRQTGTQLKQLRDAVPWNPTGPRASLVWVEGLAKAQPGTAPLYLTPRSGVGSSPYLLHHTLSTEYGTRWNRFEERTEDFVNTRANHLRSIPFTITHTQNPDWSMLVPKLTQRPDGLQMEPVNSRIEPHFQSGSISTVEEGLPEGVLISACGMAEMGPDGWQFLLPPSTSPRPWWSRWGPASSPATPPLLLLRGGWEDGVERVEREFHRSIRWSSYIGVGLGALLLLFLSSSRRVLTGGEDTASIQVERG